MVRKIIDAAKKGFYEYGYKDFNLQHVADIGGIPLDEIKQHYTNKLDIAVDIMLELEAELKNIIAGHPTANRIDLVMLFMLPLLFREAKSFYINAMVLGYMPLLKKAVMHMNPEHLLVH